VYARLALAALIAVLALIPATALAPPADAIRWRYLPPPSGNYTPRHVWQTSQNCLWAAGSMLLDKWSHGRVRASQYTLRKASGDKEGGSNLRDLARGYAKAVRVKLRTPNWGDSMRWWQLLDRLASGGGAVVIGEYNRMPAHFARWSPSYAARRESSHAVYVERYDRRRGRVWIKDPLARGGWPGEWIPVDALRRFADIEGGIVQGVATPPRRRPSTAPLIDQAYRLGDPVVPRLVLAGHPLTVKVPLRVTGGFPWPEAQRLVATWRRVGGAGSGDAKLKVTRSRTVRPTRSAFSTRVAVPDDPGVYRVSLKFAAARGRSPDRAVGEFEVRVAGPYAAAIAVAAPSDHELGTPVPLDMSVTNVGSEDWRRTPERELESASADQEFQADREASLRLAWVMPDREPVDALLVSLPLAPGERFETATSVQGPPTPGTWRLVASLDHPVLGPMDLRDAMAPVTVTFVDPEKRPGY
jgi:hypothetical protein